MILSKVCKFIAKLTITYRIYLCFRKKKSSSFEASIVLDSAFLLLAIIAILTHFFYEIFGYEWTGFLLYFFLAIQISRIIEIPFAFLSDIIDKLNPDYTDKHINLAERIQLSVLVYFETILNYSLIYKILPNYYWMWYGKSSESALSILDSIYFSIITITTLGYGDITPASNLSKFLSMAEVMTSFVIVIMSIAIYVGKSKS